MFNWLKFLLVLTAFVIINLVLFYFAITIYNNSTPEATYR